jgi:hypothetical protein
MHPALPLGNGCDTVALYKQTGRCEVTTTFIVIALFCCQKFDHSRSLLTTSSTEAIYFAQAS